MGWSPQVRRHKPGKGVKRRPWYTITIGGRDIPLGTDKAAAYIRAGDLLATAGVPQAEPRTVHGLVTAYAAAIGRKPQGAVRFGEWAGPSKLLVELEPGDLQRFADWLVSQQTRPRKLKPTPAGEKPRKPKPPHRMSAWSVRHYVADARQAWRWGVQQGWPICEPGKVKTSTPVTVPRDERPAAVRAALGKLSTRAADLVRFIAGTGCRPSEARKLQWEHLDLAHAVAVLGEHKTRRTGRPRTLHLPPAVVAIVEAQPRAGAYVFVTRFGRPWTKDGLHTVLARAGIRSAYSLRHTFAQWFLDHGGAGGGPGDKAELQAWLGHADGRMTDVYAQVRDRRLQGVARRLRGPLGA